jgi:hypothetical protein
MKLVIATPFYSMSAFTPYLDSLIPSISALNKSGIVWDFWDVSGDSYVDRARNTICARFLNSDYTHLLFIDSDISWNVEGLGQLLQSPFELTGGIYPCKNNWDSWTERMRYDKDHAPIQEADTGLVEVEWLPAGFMLITKSCIEKIVSHYYDNWYHPDSGNTDAEKIYSLFECSIIDHVRQGEDVTFCKKWAAIGGKIYCEPRISFGHSGMKTYEGNFHEHLKASSEVERIRRALSGVETIGVSNVMS